MTPHKLNVFISVYNSDTWITSKEITTNHLSLRTVNKHLNNLAENGFLDRVKAPLGGYRYQVSDTADLQEIKTWAKILNIPIEMQKKPKSNEC